MVCAEVIYNIKKSFNGIPASYEIAHIIVSKKCKIKMAAEVPDLTAMLLYDLLR